MSEPLASSPTSSAPSAARGRSFISAFIGLEEYALPLSRVHEVIACTGLTRVPTAPAFISGLANLHGAAVPVVDLTRRFGAAVPQATGYRSVVVLEIRLREKPTLLGILIDRLGRVIHVSPEAIVPPPLLEALIAVEFLDGVLQGEGGFVLCVDVDHLFGADEAAQITEISQQPVAKAPAPTWKSRLPHLHFRLAGQHCAVGLRRLREITPCGRIARIPGAASFVLGATNVRGSIVPVVDVGRRYGVAETPPLPTSCLLLVQVGEGSAEALVGLVVDSIEGLVQIAEHEVNTTPPFGARFPSHVLLGMAPIGAEFVPILDTEIVLSEDGAPSTTRGACAPTLD